MPSHRVLDRDAAEFSRILADAGFHDLRVREMHFWTARLALAYVQWPRWSTDPTHGAGEFLLDHFGKGRARDYKAIAAMKSSRPLCLRGCEGRAESRSADGLVRFL